MVILLRRAAEPHHSRSLTPIPCDTGEDVEESEWGDGGFSLLLV